MSQQQHICHCPSYAWPHRRGGGSCLWSPHRLEPTCEECGQVCGVEYGQAELGDGEGAGVYCLSKCCSAAVIQSGEYVQAHV